jgi:hypothetical protein
MCVVDVMHCVCDRQVNHNEASLRRAGGDARAEAARAVDLRCLSLGDYTDVNVRVQVHCAIRARACVCVFAIICVPQVVGADIPVAVLTAAIKGFAGESGGEGGGSSKANVGGATGLFVTLGAYYGGEPLTAPRDAARAAEVCWGVCAMCVMCAY